MGQGAGHSGCLVLEKGHCPAGATCKACSEGHEGRFEVRLRKRRVKSVSFAEPVSKVMLDRRDPVPVFPAFPNKAPRTAPAGSNAAMLQANGWRVQLAPRAESGVGRALPPPTRAKERERNGSVDTQPVGPAKSQPLTRALEALRERVCTAEQRAQESEVKARQAELAQEKAEAQEALAQKRTQDASQLAAAAAEARQSAQEESRRFEEARRTLQEKQSQLETLLRIASSSQEAAPQRNVGSTTAVAEAARAAPPKTATPQPLAAGRVPTPREVAVPVSPRTAGVRQVDAAALVARAQPSTRRPTVAEIAAPRPAVGSASPAVAEVCKAAQVGVERQVEMAPRGQHSTRRPPPRAEAAAPRPVAAAGSAEPEARAPPQVGVERQVGRAAPSQHSTRGPQPAEEAVPQPTKFCSAPNVGAVRRASVAAGPPRQSSAQRPRLAEEAEPEAEALEVSVAWMMPPGAVVKLADEGDAQESEDSALLTESAAASLDGELDSDLQVDNQFSDGGGTASIESSAYGDIDEGEAIEQRPPRMRGFGGQAVTRIQLARWCDGALWLRASESAAMYRDELDFAAVAELDLR